MPKFEYKVVPAPAKGRKARGVKTPEARFAHCVELVLNQMGKEGWEYQRAELLPSEERTGLTGSTTNWRNVLVFRRAVTDDSAQPEPRMPGMADADGGENAAPSIPAPSLAQPATGNAPRLVATPDRAPGGAGREKELRVVAAMTSSPENSGKREPGKDRENGASDETGATKDPKD